ncbi:hypothetical protein FN846DRAFT_10590 [Sphaerosporella brunnea]|uniref:Transcription factor domain-containing protein n=1 Tax=Sphaerosporella brunnea TaxID=1250544 RepID=A0A5J5EX35_9PEZI|nr:hypothetical protein FN846DRAFT_10590 [Sphaerosporella brunnea]
MCQTVFDLRLQLPCEEFLWHASTPSEWIERLGGAQEGQGFLETIRIFLDVRREPPALIPLSMMLILHGLVTVGLDLQRRASPMAVDASDLAVKQESLERGLESWRSQFDELMPQVLVQSWYQKGVLMYHMSNIALHTNRTNLLAATGDRRFFRRNSNDFYMAKQELRQWMSSPSAQLATWHSVQILLSYLGTSQVYNQDLYVSWSTYIATLVCWAYGQSEAAESEDPVWDLEQDMRLYLQQMSTETWENLGHVRRQYKGRTAGLIAVVRDTMKLTRWGSVQEGLEILNRLGVQRGIKSV